MAYVATRCDSRTFLQRQLLQLALLHVPTFADSIESAPDACSTAQPLQVQPTTEHERVPA